MEVWFRSFSFEKWVIFRFQPFIFQGVQANSFNPEAFDASEGIFPVIDGVCGQFDDFVQQASQ